MISFTGPAEEWLPLIQRNSHLFEISLFLNFVGGVGGGSVDQGGGGGVEGGGRRVGVGTIATIPRETDQQNRSFKKLHPMAHTDRQ